MRMFCKNCGEKIYDNDKFCSNCGSLVEIPQAKKKTHKKLITILLLMIIITVFVFVVIAGLFQHNHNINGKLDIGFGLGMTEDEFSKESEVGDDFEKAETYDTNSYIAEIPEKGVWYAVEGNVITAIALWDFESDLCIDGIYVGQSFTEACEMAKEEDYIFEEVSTITNSGENVTYEGSNYRKNGVELRICEDDLGRVVMVDKYF